MEKYTDYQHVELRYRVFLAETVLKRIDKITNTFFIDQKTKLFPSARVS